MDYLGNSWFSKFWDRTFLSLGRKIAINWDHGGRGIIEETGAVAVGILAGAEAIALYDQIGFGSAMSAMFGLHGAALTVGNAALAGGAAGFTSSAMTAAFHGANFGHALEAGIIGGALGAASGAILQAVSNGITNANLAEAMNRVGSAPLADDNAFPTGGFWNSGEGVLNPGNQKIVLDKLVVNGSKLQALIWNYQSVDAVGHVALVIAGTSFMISSYFPQQHKPWGKLVNKSYNATLSAEGRKPDEIYTFQIPNPQAAIQAAVQEGDKGEWFMLPGLSFGSTVNCVYGSTCVLNAGGLDLPQFLLPSGLANWLEGVRAVPPPIWIH